MKYIFVDFEMLNIDKKHKAQKRICKQEIIEIGAVMFDENYNEISSFKKYIKPEFSDRVSKKIQELTGITNSTLENQGNIEEGLAEFTTWALSEDSQIEVYAWSDSDLIQIEKECELKNISIEGNLATLVTNWNNLQDSFDKAVNAKNSTSLANAIYAFDSDFEGQMHDALDDARNTAIIHQKLQDSEAVECAKKYIKKYLSGEYHDEVTGTTLGDLFDFSKFTFCA